MPRTPTKTSANARSRRSAARVPRHIEIRQRQLQATLSTTLRQARKRAGMTQVEVAAAIGTHPEVYGRMERGSVMPSLPSLLRLCLALGSGPHELMGFSELGPAQTPLRACMVPPSLSDAPEKRRLLRRLARLDRQKFKALARLVALLQPGY